MFNFVHDSEYTGSVKRLLSNVERYSAIVNSFRFQDGTNNFSF